ncbi:hypothetical protein SAMN05216464_113119 [Mucilaginibacter pineti]|uniref:Uncharacterized protein n=1 Tax=Mucilaginibacter pineti TaxID=1391627 RepID=A0A1G7IPY9_9SPHI|nr:hypothetical protein [Mucilaginibacter pineti]SDF14810.1 hypothetical protein SAMN05216464_113119 [Mucilaginibacter pineti]
MLQDISWGELAGALIIVLIVYYGFLAIKYAGDIKDFKPRRKPAVLAEDEKFSEEPEEELDELPEDSTEESVNYAEKSDALFDRIEKLVAAFKERITLASKENLVKGQLNEELKKIISGYPDLVHTSYRTALNELIIYECTENGLTAPNEEEVEELWVM